MSVMTRFAELLGSTAKKDLAGQSLVRPRQPKRLPVENCFPALDLYPNHTGKHTRGRDEREEKDEQ